MATGMDSAMATETVVGLVDLISHSPVPATNLRTIQSNSLEGEVIQPRPPFIFLDDVFDPCLNRPL